MQLQNHLRYVSASPLGGNGDLSHPPPPITAHFLSPSDFLRAMTLPEQPISDAALQAMQLPSE